MLCHLNTSHNRSKKGLNNFYFVSATSETWVASSTETVTTTSTTITTATTPTPSITNNTHQAADDDDAEYETNDPKNSNEVSKCL